MPTEPGDEPAPGTDPLTLVETPDVRSIDQLGQFLKVPATACLKTLLVAGNDTPAVGLLLRGDHQLNAIKAERLPAVAQPLRMLRDDEVTRAVGAEPGFVGPIGVNVPLIVDHAAAAMTDFVCGANQQDQHYRGANWRRDLPLPPVADLRNAVAGDPSPRGGGALAIARGIEVGHIFQLGSKYSDAMDATVLDKDGKTCVMQMGCYGIGVTRVVAAAIEQNHDDNGIIWPDSIAPFQVALLPMNMHKSQRLRDAVEKLHDELESAGFDVLLDDRKERPGVMFADMELIGIPHRIVIGERGLKNGVVEYKSRQQNDTQDIAPEDIISHLKITSK